MTYSEHELEFTFAKKLNRVTPSLATPGDINLSDTTDSAYSRLKVTTAGGGSGAVELRGWPAVFTCCVRRSREVCGL